VKRLALLFAALLALATPAQAQTAPAAATPAAAAPAAAAPAQTGIPLDKGLPIAVRISVAYADIAGFDENAGTFEATVDVRSRWQDLRLKQSDDHASDPPLVLHGADADAKLATMWVPKLSIINLKGEASYNELGLRIFPDGTVELMHRTTGVFTMSYDAARFPFDRQNLEVDVADRDNTTDSVILTYDQDDLDYSRASDDASLNGWSLGLVTLKNAPLPGWYMTQHPKIVASLQITRYPGLVVAAIFIPLFAALLIPLLAIWLNRVEDGRFEIETFELVNLIIGGLFAVIALNFTVYGSYGVLSSGDNAVNRMFALNYITLGVSLAVNVIFYRFNVLESLFGRWVQEQAYLYLSWAIPVLALTFAAAIMLVTVV
jgi:hypothetical protein